MDGHQRQQISPFSVNHENKINKNAQVGCFFKASRIPETRGGKQNFSFNVFLFGFLFIPLMKEPMGGFSLYRLFAYLQ